MRGYVLAVLKTGPTRVSLLPVAEEEIAEAFHCYCERSLFAADAFRTEVITAIDSLAEDPLMWPADPEAVHYCVSESNDL